MPQHLRAAQIEKRTTRLKLPIERKPYYLKIGDGLSLGYRRNATEGTWVVRKADGKGSNWTKAIGTADDYQEPDGRTVYDFWGAQERARELAATGKHQDEDQGRPLTIAEALDRYQDDLAMRGGEVSSVKRVRLHLPPSLGKMLVAAVTSRDLRHWRDALTKKRLAAASVNRIVAGLKAACNLAADLDERISSRRAWEKGLLTIPDADRARNVILAEKDVRAIVAAAYAIGDLFGEYVEVAAVSGARPSQIARLEVADLQWDRADPRLMMPSSKKGRGQKKIVRRPVAITESLALRLRQAASGRPVDAPLLRKPAAADEDTLTKDIREKIALMIHTGGMSIAEVARRCRTTPTAVRRWAARYEKEGLDGLASRYQIEEGGGWGKSTHSRLFADAAAAAKVDGATIYALRHTSIARQLIAGIPIRLVALGHDTSVAMIEKNYSRYITDHSDAVIRPTLLDLAKPAAGANVVPLRK